MKNTSRFHLCEVPKVVKFITTGKVEWWFLGAGEREEELVFNRYKVSGLQDEKTYGDGWW